MNKQDNPLFAIAEEKHREDAESLDYHFLFHNEDSCDTYTLGFCRGVGYAAEMFEKQIADLNRQLSELSK